MKCVRTIRVQWLSVRMLVLGIVGIALIVPVSVASAAAATDLSLGQAVLYTGATTTEISTWSTAFAYTGGNIVAKHIAITSDFRLFNEDFPDNEAYGLNINTGGLVNTMSPFFLDPTGTSFEMDVDRGDAQWALSYYESRGPLEADYGRTSRNCRPVAGYAWGTVANIVRNGDVVSFDLVLDPGLVEGSKSFGVPIGTESWYVEFDSVALTGTATAVPEPATMGLLALGGLAMIRRRRGEGLTWRVAAHGHPPTRRRQAVAR